MIQSLSKKESFDRCWNSNYLTLQSVTVVSFFRTSCKLLNPWGDKWRPRCRAPTWGSAAPGRVKKCLSPDTLLTGTGHRDRRLNRDSPGQTGTNGMSNLNVTSGSFVKEHLLFLVFTKSASPGHLPPLFVGALSRCAIVDPLSQKKYWKGLVKIAHYDLIRTLAQRSEQLTAWYLETMFCECQLGECAVAVHCRRWLADRATAVRQSAGASRINCHDIKALVARDWTINARIRLRQRTNWSRRTASAM